VELEGLLIQTGGHWGEPNSNAEIKGDTIIAGMNQSIGGMMDGRNHGRNSAAIRQPGEVIQG
jgi:hypothetical protein